VNKRCQFLSENECHASSTFTRRVTLSFVGCERLYRSANRENRAR